MAQGSAWFRLDGLLLEIEGVGRAVDPKIEDDGRAVLQALGVISFDDEAGVYWMRAGLNRFRGWAVARYRGEAGGWGGVDLVGVRAEGVQDRDGAADQ